MGGGGKEMECKAQKQPENQMPSHRKQKLDDESEERIRMQKKQRKTHFDCKAEM